MHFLYIIYSPTADKYYVGETNNVPERIKLHNSYKKIKMFTGAPSDWELKRIFNCNSRKEAVSLKKYMDKKKSREFISGVISKPGILKEMMNKPE